ncbi:ModD protein [Caenispirillum bisanense]|uniref:Putative pyrophosphorylase ModD n=1 Tax=Caenispirillum bisanense TaxID=414052 RepID=A0A286GIF0_9PROT|nr:ModD protein [Caenispirillum bisanense]SOD95301.1 molybdenum transport protein [Caenispirillum bisanense]
MTTLPDALLLSLLADDAPFGDLTTEALGIGSRAARISFAARDPLTLAGGAAAARMLELAGAARVEIFAAEGAALAPGAPILAAEGSAAALHRAWKASQTLVETLSGIATRAAAMVAAARRGDPAAVVACTRKTFPGGKALCVAAVKAGGAQMHRLSLSETVLLFPEHLVFEPDPAAAIARVKARLPEKKVVVEVGSLDDALAAARAGVDVIQLEKLSPEQAAAIAAALRALPQPPVLAAAGGVTADNAEAYARAGCRVLVTTWPYLAKPADVQVRLGPLPGH